MIILSIIYSCKFIVNNLFAVCFCDKNGNLVPPELNAIKENYSKIKTPEDVRAIREWKEECEATHGAEVVKIMEVS